MKGVSYLFTLIAPQRTVLSPTCLLEDVLVRCKNVRQTDLFSFLSKEGFEHLTGVFHRFKTEVWNFLTVVRKAIWPQQSYFIWYRYLLWIRLWLHRGTKNIHTQQQWGGKCDKNKWMIKTSNEIWDTKMLNYVEEIRTQIIRDRSCYKIECIQEPKKSTRVPEESRLVCAIQIVYCKQIINKGQDHILFHFPVQLFYEQT